MATEQETTRSGTGVMRHPLRFGVVMGQHQLTWPQLLEQWKLAEELGFDSAWLFDHFTALYGDPDGPCLEASTLLAALARETSRIRIGVLVYGNTHRHPAILAKSWSPSTTSATAAWMLASARVGTSASTPPTVSHSRARGSASRCWTRRWW